MTGLLLLEAVFAVPFQKMGMRTVSLSIWAQCASALVDEAANAVWIVRLSRNKNLQFVRKAD